MSDRADGGETDTPLPLRVVSILGGVLSANNCAIWIIFTMIPFMVQHFFPELSEKELGKQAGILGSAFACGSLFGNFLWGILADRIGRKPAMVGGLLGSTFSALMFGFAPNFWIAVIARFLWGFLNGNIGVSKTYLAEILNDSNNAKGMAIFGSFAGIGRTAGPIIGGFLISPAISYPGTFRGTLFERYPFALPVMVPAVATFLMAITAAMYLPETLKGAPYFDEAFLKYSLYGDVHPVHKSSELTSTEKARQRAGSATYSPLLGSPEDSLDDSQSISDSSSQANHDSGGAIGSDVLMAGRGSDDCFTATPTRPRRKAELSVAVGGEQTLDKAKRNDKKNKRRLTFANVVMVKTIGSDKMAYGPLKKVLVDDVPITSPDDPSSPRSDDGTSAKDTDMLLTSDERQESYYRRDPLGLEEFESEGEEELTPVKGFGLGPEKDHASPPTNRSSSIKYSNGSEFYATIEQTYYQSSGLVNYFKTICYLLSRRQILLSTFLYGLNAHLTVVAVEIFPLWMVTKEEDGGFNYSSKLIGLTTCIAGPVTIAAQLLFYPSYVEKYGLLKVYKMATRVYIFAALLMPMISYTTGLNNFYFTYITVACGLSILNSMQIAILLNVFSFINNSCYSYQRSTVNSIGQTFAALGRLSGPYLGASLFAWSETNGLGWPMNYCFVWYLVAGLAYLSGHMATYFPRSIQRRKREPKHLRYASPGLGGGSSLAEEFKDYDAQLEADAEAEGSLNSTEDPPSPVTNATVSDKKMSVEMVAVSDSDADSSHGLIRNG